MNKSLTEGLQIKHSTVLWKHRKKFQHTWQLLQSQLHPNYSSAPGAGSLCVQEAVESPLEFQSDWQAGIFFFWHTDVCMLFFMSCEWWTAVTSIMDGLCVCLWDRPVIIFQTSLSHTVSHRISFSLHSYLNNRENKFTYLLIFKTWMPFFCKPFW